MNKFKIALLGLVLALGLFLHVHSYRVNPPRCASCDEYTYAFLGVSLLTTGVPTSWSYVPGYPPQKWITIRGIHFPIVSPYFDHPPLNALLVGEWAILNGQKTFASIQLPTIRLVPIALSVVSAFLIFLIMYKLYSYQVALFATLIYNTTTLYVVSTRVVFAENLLTPLLLFGLYLFSLWHKKMTFKKTIILGIISGLSIWTKELGIITFLTLAFLFLYQKLSKKYFFTFTVTFFLFVFGYILYGIHYNAHLFWTIVFAQSARMIGPQTLLMFLSQPIIVNRYYTDGWYIFGFLSFFFLMQNYSKYFYIIVPSFFYLFLLFFSIATDSVLGWYSIVLFPFFSMAASILIQEALNKKNWLLFFFLSFVGFYELQYDFLEMHMKITTLEYRIFLFLLFGPFLLAFLFVSEKWWRRLGLLYFYMLIVGNILLTYFYIHPG